MIVAAGNCSNECSKDENIFTVSDIDDPEIKYGTEGVITVTVTSSSSITNAIRKRYELTWTDYEGNMIDDRNDYTIVQEPYGRLGENEILKHELTIARNIIKTVILELKSEI